MSLLRGAIALLAGIGAALEVGAGPVKPIALGDLGSRLPDELPEAGPVEWAEPLPGFWVASLDVLFHGEIVDRIQLLRIDPARYRFGVHCDPSRRTAEEWRQSLGAIAVINGSYFDDHGLPVTPTASGGRRLDRAGSSSDKGGAFLAEPVEPGLARTRFLDCRSGCEADRLVRQYRTIVFSFPTLLDLAGRSRVKMSVKRATRAFIAGTRRGDVVIGHTQGGFFSLGRLGRFLGKERSKLELDYVLNLDGGSVSCIDVKAGDFAYTRYGQWESIMRGEREERIAYDDLTVKPKMPIAISVHAME